MELKSPETPHAWETQHMPAVGTGPGRSGHLSVGTLKIDSPAQFDEPECDWTDAGVR